MLTVYGGKITTYRRLAEAALSRCCQLGRRQDDSWTADEAAARRGLCPMRISRDSPRMPCSAGLPCRRTWCARLARLYGTRMAQILGNAQRLEDLALRFGVDLTLAEVRYLVEQEWARSAEDILWRRTRLGLRLAGSAVDQLQDAVAQLLG